MELQDSEDSEGLRRLFFNATTKATELLGRNPILKRDPAHLGLGVPGIREQLVALTWVVFRLELGGGARSAECQDWIDGVGDIFEDVVRNMNLPIRSLEKHPVLALAHVEWLADLLWHTFRFQAPIYPDPAELAFQISVCTRQFTPPRREAVGTVASVAEGTGVSADESNKLVERIRAWLNHYSSKTTADGGCYSALAASLCHRLPPALATEEQSVSDAAIKGHERLWPVSITTNFDDDLEQVLNQAKRSHHVIFPVYIMRAEEIKTDWLVHSEIWVGGRSYPKCRLLGETSLKDFVRDFKGPLIIKLHGSPLTQIVQEMVVDENGRDVVGCRFVHHLILSDIDFFQEMVSENRSWPDGLAEILYQSRRTLCYLGYPLADVNNRLRRSP